MISIRWVIDIDLKELVVNSQRLDDPTACEDVVNLDASKVQFSIDARGSHDSGKGYDLQRSEVTSPLCGRRGSVFSEGVTLPRRPRTCLSCSGVGALAMPHNRYRDTNNFPMHRPQCHEWLFRSWHEHEQGCVRDQKMTSMSQRPWEQPRSGRRGLPRSPEPCRDLPPEVRSARGHFQLVSPVSVATGVHRVTPCDISMPIGAASERSMSQSCHRDPV